MLMLALHVPTKPSGDENQDHVSTNTDLDFAGRNYTLSVYTLTGA